MRVDAHHHVWRLERGDYGWLQPTPRLAPIYRDFTLDDLRPSLAAAGIDATVLVQAAPTIAETRFLLDVAQASQGLVRGVVGWVDLAAPDAPATLSALAANPLLKSIRPMLQDLDDPGMDSAHRCAAGTLGVADLGSALRCAGEAAGIAATIVDAGTPSGPRRRGRSLREAGYRDRCLAPMGRRSGRYRRQLRRVLQTLRARHRGGQSLDDRCAAALRRSRHRMLWQRSRALGQRLAGGHACRNLCRMVRRNGRHCSPGSPQRIATRFAAATRSGFTR